MGDDADFYEAEARAKIQQEYSESSGEEKNFEKLEAPQHIVDENEAQLQALFLNQQNDDDFEGAGEDYNQEETY